MSQLNSDFDQGDVVGFEEASPGAEMPAPPAAPNYRQRGFSIYTVMLIISFVFLMIAAILLFVEADKYS